MKQFLYIRNVLRLSNCLKKVSDPAHTWLGDRNSRKEEIEISDLVMCGQACSWMLRFV